MKKPKKTWSCWNCNLNGTKKEIENHTCTTEKQETKELCEGCNEPLVENQSIASNRHTTCI